MIDLDIFEQDFEDELINYFVSKTKNVHVAINEFKKFFVMSILSNAEDPDFISGYIPVEEIIDEIWHYCILQTKEYLQLCSRVRKDFVLHHRSDTSKQNIESKYSARSINAKLDILVSYFHNFGPFDLESAQHWTTAKAILEETNWNASELNKFIHGLSIGIESKNEK